MVHSVKDLWPFFADKACVARACDATALGRASTDVKLAAITH